MDRLECHDWDTDGYPGEFVYGDDVYIDDYYYTKHRALIKATNIETGNIYYFNGQTEAAESLGMSVASVCNVINGKTYTAKGFRFEYVDKEERPDAY